MSSDRLANHLQKLVDGLRRGSVRRVGADVPLETVERALIQLGCELGGEASNVEGRKYRAVSRAERVAFLPEAAEDELVAAEWISALCLGLDIEISEFYRLAKEGPAPRRASVERDTASTVGPTGLSSDEEARCAAMRRRHERLSLEIFPRKASLAHFELHSAPLVGVDVNANRIAETFGNPHVRYAEYLKFAPDKETHADGWTRAYKLRNGEITQAATCYRDGQVVTEGYLDTFLEGTKRLNPNWFMYAVQRHLQLTHEVLRDLASEVLTALAFSDLEGYGWEIYGASRVEAVKPYTGYHSDITCIVQLDSIPTREHWNLKSNAAETILSEVARLFGMDNLPQDYWDADNILTYAQRAPDNR